MGKHTGCVWCITKLGSKILAGPMLIFMDAPSPLGAIRHIVDHAGIGYIHARATLAGVTAQLLLGKFGLNHNCISHAGAYNNPVLVSAIR